MTSRSRRTRRRTSMARTAAILALVSLLGPGPSLRAQAPPAQAPPTAALDAPARRPIARIRDGSGFGYGSSAAGRPEGGGGWWLGTAGIALALAGCGWLSVASKRFLPRAAAGPLALRVVGRTSLSPKHTVYLLEVGQRILIVGTGTQGAPSLLGELTDPDDRAELAPPRGAGEAVVVASEIADPPPPRFDHRLGDDT
jgi:flagellar protein FliO/FliZ